MLNEVNLLMFNNGDDDDVYLEFILLMFKMMMMMYTLSLSCCGNSRDSSISLISDSRTIA